MNLSDLRSDLKPLARKYATYLSPNEHQSLFRNMPLDVAYECLAEANRILKKNRGAEIRANQPTGDYMVPRLRFRGPRTGNRAKCNWGPEHGRQSYCLKTEANRASLYFYPKVYC